MTAGNLRTLLRLSAALALLAVALSAWVWKAGAPLPGDEWLATRIQAVDALHRNAGWINGAAIVSRFLALGVAVWIAARPWATRSAPALARREAIVGLAAALLLSIVNGQMKLLVDSPRPTAAFGLRIDESFSSTGFPSGHVYGDVLVYGALAVFAPAYLPRWAVPVVRVVFVAIILLAGPARISVGAHWPSDTAGGYLWGGAALALALSAGRWARARR